MAGYSLRGLQRKRGGRNRNRPDSVIGLRPVWAIASLRRSGKARQMTFAHRQSPGVELQRLSVFARRAGQIALTIQCPAPFRVGGRQIWAKCDGAREFFDGFVVAAYSDECFAPIVQVVDRV